MKPKMTAGLFMLMVLFLISSCGSLNRDISFDRLSQSDMEYAQSCSEGRVTLNINVDQESFTTEKNASQAVFFPPLFYFRSFGHDGSRYGYMRQCWFMPLFGEVKSSIYDREGKKTLRLSCYVVYPLFIYAEGENLDIKQTLTTISLIPFPILGGHLFSQNQSQKSGGFLAGRYEFLGMPIIGPCFALRSGENSGRPRFLWIPCGKEE